CRPNLKPVTVLHPAQVLGNDFRDRRPIFGKESSIASLACVVRGAQCQLGYLLGQRTLLMLRDTSEDTSELRQVAPRNLLDGPLTQQYGEPVCRRIRIFEYVDGDRRFDTGEAGGAETQPANLARREIANLNASVVRYFDALSSNHFKRTINLHVLRHAHPQ